MIQRPTPSRSGRSNSRSVASSRAPPPRLHAASEYKSPSATTGSRTLALSTSINAAFRTPRSNNFMMGMRSPSSNISRPSGPKPRPPTSAMWLVAANNATGRSPSNTGVTTVKSLR